MLLSLLKILLFFAVILAAALGLNMLSANSDGIRLVVNGMEYTLGPIQAVAALALLMAASWLFFKLLGLVWAFIRFLLGDETAIDRYFARTRRKKGIEAMSQGLLAIAAGEGKEAQAMAKRAAKYLDDPRTVRLLTAQAAEVAGDNARAETVYREMLDDDRTRFVGIRGLMRQKLVEGDTQTALQLAQKAYALKPRHVEVQNTLLELSTKEGDWKGARGILKEKRRLGELPKDVHIRRDAVLALQEASDVLAQGSSVSAREAAISAAKASPDLIPAVVLAAQTYVIQKNPRNAERLLEKGWSVQPHPDLARAYAEVAPDETPAQRLKRFEALMKKNPDHEETRLLRAELLLANEDFPGARRALGDLAKTHPTTRSLSIMAAVERGEGADDAIVRAWLVKAMGASRGPQWVCDKCDSVMEDWAPVCSHCGGFDTLSWREPEHKRSAAVATGTELLPLLIGSPADTVATSETVETVEIEAPAAAEMVETPAEPASAPRKPAPPVAANVAPGMVPRESDFLAEPASTVTDPEPPAMPKARPEPEATAEVKAAPAPKPAASEARPAPKAEPAPAAAAIKARTEAGPAPGTETIAEPVRPDVEFPEDSSLPPARETARHSQPALDGDMPVRPDVEPIDGPARSR
ncbi:MAG: heme biosynthesis HemY N-terminal domain-containing protein [Paracoccus sp. (in: a-proteobacteria)]